MCVPVPRRRYTLRCPEPVLYRNLFKTGEDGRVSEETTAKEPQKGHCAFCASLARCPQMRPTHKSHLPCCGYHTLGEEKTT